MTTDPVLRDAAGAQHLRTLVARAIAMDGHATVTAQDGAEALEILTDEDGAFDLLLTDIKMPIMDGIALALAAARDFPALSSSPSGQRKRARKPAPDSRRLPSSSSLPASSASCGTAPRTCSPAP